ncbi:MAG TPA: hypothetical protein VLB04_04525 [Methanotrichaceae archaeon]|nr:hypothetical protein [Methanotrichaceae archaeon]
MPVSSGVMPMLVLSTIGTADQPGVWPPAYILGAKLILLVLTLFLGFKSLTLLFKPVSNK